LIWAMVFFNTLPGVLTDHRTIMVASAPSQ
jgi:hypothetical protein